MAAELHQLHIRTNSQSLLENMINEFQEAKTMWPKSIKAAVQKYKLQTY